MREVRAKYATLTCVISDSIPREAVATALRTSLPFFGIACIAFVGGVSSLLLTRLKSRDRLPLWVGMFSVMYAVRSFLRNDLTYAAFNLRDHELQPWALCLTYLIPIPYTLFARELFGSGWHQSIRWWLRAEIVFAAVAIPAALLTRELFWTESLNGILVIGGTLLILVHVLFKPGDPESFATSLKWPLIVFAVSVLLNNKGFRPGGMDVEPVGFLVLLGGLGVTAARRAFARERKLLDVEQELATARRIQSSIIPHSAPVLPSLRLATRYQPMTAVAGDFYDFLQTGEHQLTILVADVSGHGVPAALVASMLKICFAAQRQNATNPAGILAGLNAMLRDSLGGQYVTAACAALDTENGTVTYSGAGHPPSLLLRSDSHEVIHLAENGLFIGPFPQAAYSNVSVPFVRGDKLLLYTDGIIEARGLDGQEFGTARLEQVLRGGDELAPSQFVERLFQEISLPAQQDDLTVVMAQFH